MLVMVGPQKTDSSPARPVDPQRQGEVSLMRQSRGFTLIELVVTVAIIAIIATWAVPAWQGLVQRSQVESDVRALTHALGMARSTATTRGVDVSVCPYAPSVATPIPRPATMTGRMVGSSMSGILPTSPSTTVCGSIRTAMRLPSRAAPPGSPTTIAAR